MHIGHDCFCPMMFAHLPAEEHLNRTQVLCLPNTRRAANAVLTELGHVQGVDSAGSHIPQCIHGYTCNCA